MITAIEAAVLAFVLLCAIALIAALRHAGRRGAAEGGSLSFSAVIGAEGSVPQLQYALRRIADSKPRPGQVYIIDIGMDPDSRRMAEILADGDAVILTSPEGLAGSLEDNTWRNQRAPRC